MAVRAISLLSFRAIAMLLLAAFLLVRLGPFCEASAMVAGPMPVAMAGCADMPVAPVEKGTPADCTMTACAALPNASVSPSAPAIYAAALLPMPNLAEREGLKPAPATPPPRSA